MRRSEVKHTRLMFEPLHISCSIQCDTPASPLVQTSNTLLNEFEPDRQLTPCVIRPYVEVNDKDGIFPYGNANARLAKQSIIWRLNGVSIADIPEFAGMYEIVTADDETRGTLILSRNIPVTEEWVITFEAQFEDWRRGKIETVQSNELLMYTTDLGTDLYSVSIDKPLIEYDPVKDSLYIYEWQLNNGLIPAGNREAYKNDKSYEQDVTVLINSGTDELDELGEGLTMTVERNGVVVVPGGEDFPEITAISYPMISLDLRMIDNAKYDVILKEGSRVLTKESFAVFRKVSKVHEALLMFGSDVSPHQTNYVNMAMVNLKDETLIHPEIFFWIRWFTQAMIYNATTDTYEAAAEKPHTWGRKMDIPVRSIGMGVTKNDNYFRQGYDVEPHPYHKYATDETGNIFTDENGNDLIIQ